MRKQLTGKIVSNKMQKTVVVEVDRLKEHPKYKRRFKVSKKYKVHIGETSGYVIGDKVLIEETKPISKEKNWKVVKKINEKLGDEDLSSSSTSSAQGGLVQ